MSEITYVIKRDGTKEEFRASKINKVLEWATEGIPDVSGSEVAVHAKISIFDGISSQDIHNLLISSAADLISEENPNYSKVAARLLNYRLRKDVWGGKNPPKLYQLVKENVEKGYYWSGLLEKFSEKDFHKIDEFIDHDRDNIFEYAGFLQLVEKYLVQDRGKRIVLETPQFAYALISMVLFCDEEKDRLKFIKQAYNAFSKHKINLATPIMAGARTATTSYSSCCLIEVADNKSSLFAANSATGLAICDKYGIGLDLSNLRAIGAPIRNGETLHTGAIPWLKMFQSTVHSCQQGGARRGAATVTFPIFHFEIEDILQLKENTGTEDNRVRHLDYSITISKLFWERYLKDEDITLFSSHEARKVYDSFGQPDFDEIYCKYEKEPLQFKKKIKARDLINLLATQRVETGRIYPINIDQCNEYSSWCKSLKTSNLCLEVLHPLEPFYKLNDDVGEIGVCILSAVNMLKIDSDKDHEKVCELVVRMLDNLIDIQTYFDKSAERFATKKRSLGVGITNLAGWLASKGENHCSEKAPELVNQFMEKQQYYLLKASNNLAKERGACEKFEETKYSQGKMPLDFYNRNVDEFLTHSFFQEKEWNSLKEDIAKFGLRNCTLSCQMPCEASSSIQGSTNGMEPIRSLITYKPSRTATLPVLVPNLTKWKSRYIRAFDMPNNEGVIKIMAAINKWVDMSSSFNTYSPSGEISMKTIIKDILTATKYGARTFYYHNTDDEDKHEIFESGCSGGSCIL